MSATPLSEKESSKAPIASFATPAASCATGVIRSSAGLEAHDVEQISHQTVHSRGAALDALGVPFRRRAVAVGRRPRDQHSGAHRDAAEDVAQVVAHHSQKVVPRRNDFVSASTLDEESLVGGLALEVKEGGECPLVLVTFHVKSLIRRGPLFRDDLVRRGALTRDLPLNCRRRTSRLHLRVRELARRVESFSARLRATSTTRFSSFPIAFSLAGELRVRPGALGEKARVGFLSLFLWQGVARVHCA